MYVRRLLFELRSENSHVLLEFTDRDFLFCVVPFQPSDRRLLFFDFFVLFEELIQQHRVHLVVTHRLDLALVVAYHQVGIHSFHFLCYEPEL